MQISATFTRLISLPLKREWHHRHDSHRCINCQMNTGVTHCFHRQKRIRYAHCVMCGRLASWYTRFHIHLGVDWETDQWRLYGISLTKWDGHEMARRIQSLEDTGATA